MFVNCQFREGGWRWLPSCPEGWSQQHITFPESNLPAFSEGHESVPFCNSSHLSPKEITPILIHKKKTSCTKIFHDILFMLNETGENLKSKTTGL
jgi:hypothetical protein